MFFARTLHDPFDADRDVLARARYGVIEIDEDRPAIVHLRPWPRIVSVVDTDWFGRRLHDQRPGGRLWLYYNQPRRHSNFLALAYIVSERDCSFATFRRALFALDDVACVKRSDALLCDAWNLRISDRLFARWGWEAHKPQRWHRNFIKRFYGVYPQREAHTAGAEPVIAGDPRNECCLGCQHYQYRGSDSGLRQCQRVAERDVIFAQNCSCGGGARPLRSRPLSVEVRAGRGLPGTKS